MVDEVHKSGKKVIVNSELIGGLNLDKHGVKFLKQIFNVDVVIVSSPLRTKYMKDLDIYTIQRIVLIDSLSLETALKLVSESSCDAVEIRPAFYGMKYIDEFRKIKDIPFFLAGFVSSREMIEEAKRLKFKGITCSKETLWSYKTK